MLDLRLYRLAFLPALVAVFVLAFSLGDIPGARTTRLAPLAFDSERAFTLVSELAARFGDRRPGSAGDEGLADRVAASLERTGFAKADAVKRRTFPAETAEGDAELENVIATRPGLSRHTVIVLAHRDASEGPAAAELSATATLLELGRLLADRDLAKTVVLASVSGGSGGLAGAREVARTAPGPVDAVLVLGDMAGTRARRPFVVPWSDGAAPASVALERTAQAALKSELGEDPGRTRATAQLVRRAVPLTLSEQGAVNGSLPTGPAAILISNSSERRPAADEPVSKQRLQGFGRATLRTLTATLEAGDSDPFPAADGIVGLGRLTPTWAIRLLVLALLAPALATAFDAFFRARRRGLQMGAWTAWVVSFGAPVGLAWLWARGLDLTGAVVALGEPVTARDLAAGGAGWAAIVSLLVVAAVTAVVLRPMALRRLGMRARAPNVIAGGAGAATGLTLGVLTLVIWASNPYAAAVLLPATHAWLLATAPERRLSRGPAALVLLAGLALPLAVVGYYARAWGLAPSEVPLVAFGLVAGGVLGIAALAAVSLFAATFAATVSVLRGQRRVAQSTSPVEDDLRTRGPRSYAGPGSLGGTESALRR